MLLFPTVSWVVTFPYIDEPQSIKWFGSAIGLILCQMCVLAGCEWELKSPTIVLSKFSLLLMGSFICVRIASSRRILVGALRRVALLYPCSAYGRFLSWSTFGFKGMLFGSGWLDGDN